MLDVENRLYQVSGGVSGYILYDPLGRIFEYSGNGGITHRFLYDGDALVAEYNVNAGVIMRRYVHGSGAGDDPLIWYGFNPGQIHWLHADHQGSIVASTDGNGALESINAYDAWGIPNPANVGRFQYTGQIYLPEIGLYHYKARMYSPTLGRFLQTDPIGYEDQVNLYAYVGNDPLNSVDPSGQYECRTREDCNAAATGIAQIKAARDFYASPELGSRLARSESGARALNGLLASLGERGDGGVRIQVGTLEGGARGAYRSNIITLDLNNIRRTGARIGEVLGHEGQHYRQRYEPLGPLAQEARPLAMQYLIGIAPRGSIQPSGGRNYVRDRLMAYCMRHASRAACAPGVERTMDAELQRPF